MYNAIILILVGFAVYLIIRCIKQKKIYLGIIGGLLFITTIIFFVLLDVWSEYLWFEALGFTGRFKKEIFVKALALLGGGLFAWFISFILMSFLPKGRKHLKFIMQIIAAFFGASWGLAKWELILKFLNSIESGVVDPIFKMDTGFYLFELPFYDELYSILLIIAVLSLIANMVGSFFRVKREGLKFGYERSSTEMTSTSIRAFFVSVFFLILVLAFGRFLDRYHIMYSSYGAVNGAGWTDVNVRIPGYYIVIAISLLIAVAIIIPKVRDLFIRKIRRWKVSEPAAGVNLVIAAGVIIFLSWFIFLTLIPGLFQWLRVNPNEITFEKPYIEHNIKYTRFAFNLNEVEVKEYPALEVFNREMAEQNKSLFENIRLWDWRALDAVYKQFQEIRLYYEFYDVDVDRYTIDGKYRQVMISAREMNVGNLPKQSQTFVNTRFKYTHGYGLTLTPVNDFTPEGLPNLLIKDIPPVSAYSSLEVERPEIYYGELTDGYVVGNSKEKEFDYPKGDKNIYTHYKGSGGVQLKGWFRKFIYGWKFDGTRFFVSQYPDKNSRIMFHRRISKRVQNVAPFLKLDDDPYIVLVDGKLYWIIDCYTTSTKYPYSEPFSSKEIIEYKEGDITRRFAKEIGFGLSGINYMRNSVKAVVDAYNGNVDLYIYDEDDPIIQVWNKIFPDIFKEKSEMPAGIRAHVRYPSDYLLVQGLVYAKYHMTDPTVFYNQEDLWVRATEKYYDSVQPVEPYYIMWRPPEEEELEFVLILPFTPKNRQVLIGWISGMCDEENYGRFLAYKFPKEKRIIGPQQVETKIDQDSYLSGQLSLWDQRGSNVIRGNVLAIPVAETVLYVEPIYLQAETAAYPELRLVALMYDDVLSYAETFEEALAGLFKGEKPKIGKEAVERAAPAETSELVKEAGQAFDNYLKSMGNGSFDASARYLDELKSILNSLNRRYEAD